jgi:hypothetical protein
MHVIKRSVGGRTSRLVDALADRRGCIWGTGKCLNYISVVQFMI